MTERTVSSIRQEMAERGIELTPDQLDEVLQASAHIASYIGGSVTIDSGSFWGLYVEVDMEHEGECWVDLILYDEDADDVDTDATKEAN